MSFEADLLAQAQRLLVMERTRPKQASLRRAVSTAYYALFHRLTDASSRLLVSGTGEGREDLRQALRRSYVHTTMRAVSRSFAAGSPPEVWRKAAGSPSHELRFVCETFADLQEARHAADYDHTTAWTKNESRELVQRVARAFELWDQVKGRPDARAYLVGLLAPSRRT